MDSFLIGWVVLALVVSILFGWLVHVGAHDLSEPRPMKKIREAGF